MAVALLAALFSLAAPAGPASASPDDGGFASRMLSLVNQQRASAGVAPVQWSAGIAGIAADSPYTGCGFSVAGRATDMGTRNYFSHTVLGCGTQSVFNMLTAAGIQSSGSGENIAWMNGTTDPLLAADRLMNDLMASPGHRDNILNPNYTHVGVGSWTTPAGQTWSGGGTPLTRVWIATQVFARMPVTGAPAVAIAPSSLAFGSGVVGSTSTVQSVTISNTGNAPLTISRIAVSGPNAGDFTIASNSCGSVPAGGSCAAGVAFAPTAAGSRSATLVTTDDAAGSPHSLSLSGTAVTPAFAGPPTNVQATSGDASLTATWTAHVNQGSGVDGYGIFAYDLSGAYTGHYASVCSTCMTGTVTGLANGHWAYAIVYSHTASGWGGSAYTAAAVMVGTPAAPGNVVATKGSGQATVTWSPASGGAVDGYALLAFDSNGYAYRYAYPCATCTSGTVTGLTNGTTYTIMVYAHNAYGWSAATASNPFVAGP